MVRQIRKGRRMTKKERVALISLLASVGVTAAKLIVGLLIGSLALITDALHSGTDSIATIVTLITVRMADRPADEDHPYGHGKFENVAAMGEATLLLVLAGGVAVEAWTRLGENAPPPEVGIIPFTVMGVEILINLWRAWVLNKTAIETGSSALAADAMHFASDVGSGIIVIIGLFATWLGFKWADPISAVAVALFIGILGLRMIRRTFDELTDRVPPGLIRSLTRSVEALPGVVEVSQLRVRSVGHQFFVDVVATVPRSFAFEQIMAVKQRISDTVKLDLSGAEITASCNPVAMDDETVRERVHLAATRHFLPIHHVTIQHVGDRLAVSLDLEVDGDMPLGHAHEVASLLEDAVRSELGDDVEVETHLEPLHPDLVPGEPLEDGRTEAIVVALHDAAITHGATDIHNVRVRELENGLFVAFHCRFAPELIAREVHRRADAVERETRARFPEILRIVSHPEPIRA
jgi:cation diffusion facilitator family transporter